MARDASSVNSASPPWMMSVPTGGRSPMSMVELGRSLNVVFVFVFVFGDHRQAEKSTGAGGGMRG